jgi:hypothetical protein
VVHPHLPENDHGVQYVQAPALVRDYAGSTFVLPPTENEPLALRATAREIWLQFARPATIDSVAARLETRFAVGGIDTIRRDVAALVEELVRRDVLEVA